MRDRKRDDMYLYAKILNCKAPSPPPGIPEYRFLFKTSSKPRCCSLQTNLVLLADVFRTVLAKTDYLPTALNPTNDITH